jgi:hypothetical protein
MSLLSRLVVGLVLVTMLPAGAAERGLIINEDNSHFFTTRAAEDMTLTGLHAFVDQYADTRVSHLFLCPNAMRASFKSATRDAIWELGKQKMPPPGILQLWISNAQLLHEKGLDPYAIWIARAREKGISPWLSMRMNDVHESPDETNFMHSTFWRENPQFWRAPHSTSGSWVDRALDYGHPEVRAHAMDFIKELLERYDMDGLELDWMRFGWHFKAGEEAEGAEILTTFVREVRQLTQGWSEKRGHPILLGARVPAHPDAARGLGMDGVRWAREGLVDMLVPAPFWTTTDFDIPVELWRTQLGAGADRVVLAPGIEYNSRAYSGGNAIANDLAATRGFAASAWYRGADQIYLFNYMDSQTRPVSAANYKVLLQQGLGLDLVSSLPRRHIQTYRDTVPAGFPSGAVLPAEGEEASFTMHIGSKSSAATVTFLIGLAQRDGVAEALYTATVNGVPCEVGTNVSEPGNFPGAARAIAFACPLEAVRDGANSVVVKQPQGQQIVWAEMRVTAHTVAPQGPVKN